MRALIVCSTNPRGALSAARCLSDASWTVSAAATDHLGPLSWSRRVDAVYPLPTIEAGIDDFIEAIENAVIASRAEVVLPAGDAELLALSHARSRISAVVPFASDETVRRIVDKSELVALARRAGLDGPSTRPATDEAVSGAALPVMVKSRFHWLPDHATYAPARLEAELCTTLDEVTTAVAAIRKAGGEALLQDYSNGTQINVHALSAHDGTLLAFDQQVDPGLLYPPRAGVRVRSVSTPIDETLLTGVQRLLHDVGWFGLAGLHFLREVDGRYLIIDFNGRIPANLVTSYAAGLNLVAGWTALATGRTPPPLDRRKVGARFQWLEGDLRRAVKERRGGLVRDVAGALRYAVGASHTIGHWDEPELVARYTLRHARLLAAGWRRGHRQQTPR